MKIRLYQPCNNGTYHTIPDNMLVSNPEHFYTAADYEALKAKLKTCCTIEAMLANPNVNSLIKQHEKTIEELEAKLAALESELAIAKAGIEDMTGRGLKGGDA